MSESGAKNDVDRLSWAACYVVLRHGARLCRMEAHGYLSAERTGASRFAGEARAMRSLDSRLVSAMEARR
jgi:hypothetical protein